MKIKLNPLYIFGAFLLAFVFFAHAPQAFADCASHSLTFTAVQNGPAPAQINCGVYNITPSGGAPLTWSSNQQLETGFFNWAAQSGTVNAAGPNDPLTVSIPNSATSLSVGTHHGQIVASGGGSVTIDVYLNITSPSCSISSFSASPNPVSYNSSTTLSWSSSNCTGATLSGGQFGGGTSVATNNAGLATNTLTSAVTYTLCLSGASGSPCQNVTVNVNAPCNVTSFTYSGYPGSLPYNTAANLTVATTGCTSASISGGQYGGGQSATLNGSFSTNALTTSTTYTYTATGPGNSSPVVLTVPIGSACTINVNSTTNGVSTPPSGGYNYSISGPGTITGSGNAGYAETPAAQSWIITYTGGSTIPFTGYNNNSQACSSAGGSITFTLNFNNPPPGPPSNVTADNSNTNATVQCNQVLLNWNAGTTATSYNIYRSDNPSVVLANVTGTTYTDTISSGSYTYNVQSVNAYGVSSQASSNQIQPTPCVADFSLSDMQFKDVNGVSLNFNSNCVASQSGPSRTIKDGDVIKTSVCLVNNGTLDANSVVLVLNTANSYLANQRNFVYNGGGAVATSTSGNLITINLGTIAIGQKVAFTFDSDVTVPPGDTQQLRRMRYTGSFTFTTSKSGGPTGCYGTQATAASPCRLDTGYTVFYNGLKSPDQKEVNP